MAMETQADQPEASAPGTLSGGPCGPKAGDRWLPDTDVPLAQREG